MVPKDLTHRPIWGTWCCCQNWQKRESWTPASIKKFQIRTTIRRKLDDSEKHKRRIFSYDGWTNFWDFVGLNFSIVKFLWANPLAWESWRRLWLSAPVLTGWWTLWLNAKLSFLPFSWSGFSFICYILATMTCWSNFFPLQVSQGRLRQFDCGGHTLPQQI